MINIVVPVVDKPEEYSKAISNLSLGQEVKFIVGVTENLESELKLPPSAVVKIFKNGSKKEEIINSLKGCLDSGKVVIARRPFTKNEIERLISSDAQITYLAAKRKNGFKEFFKKLISGFVKLLFGVDFFDGDISLISFNEDMGEVLVNVNSLSYATRVDRWRGVEKTFVEGEKDAVKIDIDKKSNINLSIFASLSILVPALITTLVGVFTKVNFVVGMLLFCICLLGLVGSLLILCTLYFNNKVGKRYFKDAEER